MNSGDLYTLLESPFFEWELSHLGEIRELDEILMNATRAIAQLADDLPLAPHSESIRYLSWEPVLQDDGTLIRLLIYFVISNSTTAELVSTKGEPL